MNFLAHLFLTYGDEELTVGNYLADFIRNRDLLLMDEKIVRGVKLHRHIDKYTDTHPVVIESTHTLHTRHGKYAPVVIDVFYDFILSKNWSRFCNVSLREFADDIYLVLNKYSEDFPFHLQDLTYRMIADDFLLQYGKIAGIQKAFDRISRRAKFESNFESAVDDLLSDYEFLEEGFLEFFPDIINQVQTFDFVDRQD